MLMNDNEEKRNFKAFKIDSLNPEKFNNNILNPKLDRFFLDAIFGWFKKGKDDAWMLKYIYFLPDYDSESPVLLTKELLSKYKERLFPLGHLDYDRFYMDKILYHNRPGYDTWAHGYVPDLSEEAYKEYRERLMAEGGLLNRKVIRLGTSILDKHFMYQMFYFYRTGKDDEWIRKYLQESSVEVYNKYKDIFSNEKKLRRMNLRSYKDFGYLNLHSFIVNEYYVEQIIRYRQESRDDQSIQKILGLSTDLFEKFKKLLKEEL